MENLPVLEQRDGKLFVIGKTERKGAHGKNPQWHATALIIAITPTGKILLADKFKKNLLKAQDKNAVIKPEIILDCFGGHLKYEDIPQEDLISGLSYATFRDCAMRELHEELLQNSGRPLEIDPSAMKFLSYLQYRNDHNMEYSAVFIYNLDHEDDELVSIDSVELSSDIVEAEQPIHPFTFEELINSYLCSTFVFSDGIGRILDSYKNTGFEQLEKHLRP